MGLAGMTGQIAVLLTELGQKQIEGFVRKQTCFISIMLNLKYLWNIQVEESKKKLMYCQTEKKNVAWQCPASSSNSDNCGQWGTLNDTRDIKGGKKKKKGEQMTLIFKNLLRKEAAVKENEIYRSSFFAPTRHCFSKQMNVVSYAEFPWKDVHLSQWHCHCSKHFIRFSFILPLDWQCFIFNIVNGGKALFFDNKCISLERAQTSTRCKYLVTVLIFLQMNYKLAVMAISMWGV